MPGGGGTTTETQLPPVMVGPEYGFNYGFYNNVLPNWVGAQSPSYGGQIDRGLSPTTQAGLQYAQGFATQPQQFSQGAMGVLGNLMNGGAMANPTHQPSYADQSLQRFMFPQGFNSMPQGPRSLGGNMSNLFAPPNMGGGGFGGQQPPQQNPFSPTITQPSLGYRPPPNWQNIPGNQPPPTNQGPPIWQSGPGYRPPPGWQNIPGNQPPQNNGPQGGPPQNVPPNEPLPDGPLGGPPDPFTAPGGGPLISLPSPGSQSPPPQISGGIPPGGGQAPASPLSLPSPVATPSPPPPPAQVPLADPRPQGSVPGTFVDPYGNEANTEGEWQLFSFTNSQGQAGKPDSGGWVNTKTGKKHWGAKPPGIPTGQLPGFGQEFASQLGLPGPTAVSQNPGGQGVTSLGGKGSWTSDRWWENPGQGGQNQVAAPMSSSAPPPGGLISLQSPGQEPPDRNPGPNNQNDPPPTGNNDPPPTNTGPPNPPPPDTTTGVVQHDPIGPDAEPNPDATFVEDADDDDARRGIGGDPGGGRNPGGTNNGIWFQPDVPVPNMLQGIPPYGGIAGPQPFQPWNPSFLGAPPGGQQGPMGQGGGQGAQGGMQGLMSLLSSLGAPGGQPGGQGAPISFPSPGLRPPQSFLEGVPGQDRGFSSAGMPPSLQGPLNQAGMQPISTPGFGGQGASADLPPRLYTPEGAQRSIYDVYNSAKQTMDDDLENTVNSAVSQAGLTGNRFGSSTARTVAREAGHAQNRLNDQFTNMLFNQGESDLNRTLAVSENQQDRGLQDYLSRLGNQQQSFESSLNRGFGDRQQTQGLQFDQYQSALDRMFQGGQSEASRALQATQYGLNQDQFLTQLQSQNMNQGLDRILRSSQAGMGAQQQYDQGNMQRLQALMQAGQYETDRTDQMSLQQYQDFERNKWGFMPQMAQFITGAQSQQLDPIVTQNQAGPGFWDYATTIAAAVAPALIASDERLKTNIKPVGKSGPFEVKSWNWKHSGEPGVGLLAQDVEKILPSAVHTDSFSGLKALNVNEILAQI